MTDYTYPASDDLSDKDGLASGNPEKLILGSDLEAEFQAIATAIASKFDSTDRATQAQAEAATSSTTLITPERLGDWAAQNAGIVEDAAALTDPGADRVLFWDDSAGALAFLSVGAGLSLTGTTLASDDAAIDHDSLSGFVANEHVDHSAVSINASGGEGISAGGDLTASRTLDLDFSGLTQETTLDLANDAVAFYDASASAHRKVPLQNFVGSALGDGRWYRSSTQAISASTATTVVFNAQDYDSLERGTFSTATGIYTVGSAGARVLVSVAIKAPSFSVEDSLDVRIQVNGSTVASTVGVVYEGLGALTLIPTLSTALSLSASDEVRVQVEAFNNAANIGGSVETFIRIMELG